MVRIILEFYTFADDDNDIDDINNDDDVDDDELIMQ